MTRPFLHTKDWGSNPSLQRFKPPPAGARPAARLVLSEGRRGGRGAAAPADAEDLHGGAAGRERPRAGGEPGHPARPALGQPHRGTPPVLRPPRWLRAVCTWMRRAPRAHAAPRPTLCGTHPRCAPRSTHPRCAPPPTNTSGRSPTSPSVHAHASVCLCARARALAFACGLSHCVVWGCRARACRCRKVAATDSFLSLILWGCFCGAAFFLSLLLSCD